MKIEMKQGLTSVSCLQALSWLEEEILKGTPEEQEEWNQVLKHVLRAKHFTPPDSAIKPAPEDSGSSGLMDEDPFEVEVADD